MSRLLITRGLTLLALFTFVACEQPSRISARRPYTHVSRAPHSRPPVQQPQPPTSPSKPMITDELSMTRRAAGRSDFNGTSPFSWTFNVSGTGASAEWITRGVEDSVSALSDWANARALPLTSCAIAETGSLSILSVSQDTMARTRVAETLGKGEILLGFYSSYPGDRRIVLSTIEKHQRHTLAHELAHYAYERFCWSFHTTMDSEEVAQAFVRSISSWWAQNPISEEPREGIRVQRLELPLCTGRRRRQRRHRRRGICR